MNSNAQKNEWQTWSEVILYPGGNNCWFDSLIELALTKAMSALKRAGKIILEDKRLILTAETL